MRRLGLAPLALSAGLLLLLPAVTRAQCAMCRTTITNSAQGEALGATFNRAILVMMAAPYLVAGGFGLVFYRRRLGDAIRRLVSRPR